MSEAARGGGHGSTPDPTGPATRTRKAAAAGTAAIVITLMLLPAATASAAILTQVPAGTDLTPLEARRAERWWDGQVLVGSLAFADMPSDELWEAAQVAWAAGISKEQLRAALFTDVARDIFAGNAAGGEGQPSPYVEYFTNNPTQLGALGDLLSANRSYEAGPGGTQDELFARFTGLRESYLASLGLVEVNGRIVDPRNLYLTPYFASLVMGPAAPLPQPAVALNVGSP